MLPCLLIPSLVAPAFQRDLFITQNVTDWQQVMNHVLLLSRLLLGDTPAVECLNKMPLRVKYFHPEAGPQKADDLYIKKFQIHLWTSIFLTAVEIVAHVLIKLYDL